MFPINFPATDTVHVDPDVWKACAGANFVLPEVGSVVYYFPESHAKQYEYDASSPAVWRIFRCRVLNVRFLADKASDDVFASVLLQQAEYDFRGASQAPASRTVEFSGCLSGGVEREGLRMDSFKKTLTQSDANNGGGFSVPKQCAESLFPVLNYRDDPPVQNLTIADVQGVDWVFRHIYRGTPTRHLLTTGWSKFVNSKNLIAGDSVIFMRDNLTRRLYIGIQRVDKGGSRRFRSQSLQLGRAGSASELEDEFDEGLWKTGDRRVSARFIEAAAMHAAHGKPFEIILHPRNGSQDFVVNVDVVDRALSLRWAVGMPVKMCIMTENYTSRSTLLQGHVSMVVNPQENGQWRDSPWKMLQVTWVEPEHLQNVEWVCPWQVEYAGPLAPSQPYYSLTELKDPHYFQPLAVRNKEPHSTLGKGDSKSGMLNLTLYNSNSQLASMQGARHLSDVSVLTGGDTHQILSDYMYQRSEPSLFGSKITEVNPGGHHQSGNFSTESHSSLRSFGTEIGNLPKPCSGIKSIQLFGKLIYVNNAGESQSGEAGCIEADSSSKGDNEAVGMSS